MVPPLSCQGLRPLSGLSLEAGWPSPSLLGGAVTSPTLANPPGVGKGGIRQRVPLPRLFPPPSGGVRPGTMGMKRKSKVSPLAGQKERKRKRENKKSESGSKIVGRGVRTEQTVWSPFLCSIDRLITPIPPFLPHSPSTNITSSPCTLGTHRSSSRLASQRARRNPSTLGTHRSSSLPFTAG